MVLARILTRGYSLARTPPSERAKQLAEDGQEVLLICFNRELRDHLRKVEKDSGITFNTLHGAFMALAKKAYVRGRRGRLRRLRVGRGPAPLGKKVRFSAIRSLTASRSG